MNIRYLIFLFQHVSDVHAMKALLQSEPQNGPPRIWPAARSTHQVQTVLMQPILQVWLASSGDKAAEEPRHGVLGCVVQYAVVIMVLAQGSVRLQRVSERLLGAVQIAGLFVVTMAKSFVESALCYPHG